MSNVGLAEIAGEWGRIGCIGFGGPPTHIRLLRELCVERRAWIDGREFEDAVATCNLLPGPSSTQLAIFCAWRVGGRPGAVLGGLAFIVPGLILILALAALFLTGTPPLWARGAGAGAGAAVAAVAVQAGWSLIGPSWSHTGAAHARWCLYLGTGAIAAATLGPWLVVVLIACGLAEVTVRGGGNRLVLLVPVGGIGGIGALASLSWTALKVGALSYGGGFVIVPLMQADAVGNGWMTGGQFLNAVALGQITPGPVVQTVAVVGYAVAGIGGGLLASAMAFGPSFLFILLGADRFDRLRAAPRVRGFLDGAGPAAIGAILGSAYLLARALTEPWQAAVLAAAFVALLPLKRGVVTTLLAAGAVGVAVAYAGGSLPI